MVIKIASVNGKPCVKISDDLTKVRTAHHIPNDIHYHLFDMKLTLTVFICRTPATLRKFAT